MKRVLILDANQRSALAATRSLGRHGVPVITADEAPSSLASNSKYSESYLIYPSPKSHSTQFIDFLIKYINIATIDIVIPMTELTTTLILENQDAFSDVILPFADLNTVNSLADKCQLMRTAEKLLIPFPKTWFVDSLENLPNLDTLPYPLIMKPGKSWQCQDGSWDRHAVRIAENPSEAKKIATNESSFNGHPFMLQECVAGIGQGVFAFYERGQPVVTFAHRRLREKPPSGGVSVLCESIPVDPQLEAYSKALLDEAGWHGVAMVEFKVDPLTNTSYLMEVNTRFWGSLQLAIDAGIDFPWLLYKSACREPLSPVQDYRTGIRSRWLLGDLDNLYLRLRDTKSTIWQKITAVADFFTPHPLTTYHEVNRWDDLKPFIFELKQYLAAVFIKN